MRHKDYTTLLFIILSVKKKPSTKEECVVVIMFFMLNQRHRPRRGSNDNCTLAPIFDGFLFRLSLVSFFPLDLNLKGGKLFFGAKFELFLRLFNLIRIELFLKYKQDKKKSIQVFFSFIISSHNLIYFKPSRPAYVM